MPTRIALALTALLSAPWLSGVALAAGADDSQAAAVYAPAVDAGAYVLTPPPPDTPRINGPRVFGVRPGSRFLYAVPATGKRPMTFSVAGLPEGLQLDPETGRITGTIASREQKSYTVTLHARNALGAAEAALRVVVGDRICLTPPLGWNSWNCWARAVDQEKVEATARAMKDSGLAQHGWTYINIDDTWQGVRGGPFNGIQPNKKFPDMKELCDRVHALGLKIGIYSTPWKTSYAGFCGGSSDDPDGKWDPAHREKKFGQYPFAMNDARQWAAWGFDYLKYDWRPNDVAHVQEMRDALRAQDRDIVYSLSNNAPFNHAADFARLANCWRTTGDIRDTWGSVRGIGFRQDRWAPFTGPGHWNDPDMLVVGFVGWGPKLHPSRLTPDEQYTHISLWCLLSSPLLIGCDMTRLDAFTLGLLANDEVLAVNQDEAGKGARKIALEDGCQAWTKELADGSLAAGFFNPGDREAVASATWDALGLPAGRREVRDLWRQKTIGVFDDAFRAAVRPHGVVLVRFRPADQPATAGGVALRTDGTPPVQPR